MAALRPRHDLYCSGSSPPGGTVKASFCSAYCLFSTAAICVHPHPLGVLVLVPNVCSSPCPFTASSKRFLSTSAVLESEIDTFSVCFKTLEHLILDGCGLSTMREGEWSAIGKRCALAGVQRAREREKTLKTWLETWLATASVGNDNVLAEAAADLNIRAKKPRRGRRGLATATISLRSSSPDAASSSRPSLSTRRFEIPKIRILPPLPTLTTLSMAASSIKPDMYPVSITEFEAGWAEGIAQLAVTRARLREDGGREGLEGLEDVNKDDQAAFDMPVEIGDGRDVYRAPVLCLAGDAEVGHSEGCGHAVASRIWVG